MKKGEFIVSIQIDPPTPKTKNQFYKTIETLVKEGVNTIDVNSSRARKERIPYDSISLSIELSLKFNLEVIPHVTTRDAALDSLLSRAAHAYEYGGIKNFLIITGDPHEARKAVIPSKGIYQTKSFGAIRAFKKYLVEKYGLDITIGAAANHNEDKRKERARINKKRMCGARLFMSQTIFNKKQYLNLRSILDAKNRKNSEEYLLVGIWPLIDYKTIEKINNKEIPGVVIPEEINKEIESCKTEKELKNWGFRKAVELIGFIKKDGFANGVYIVAPLRDPLLSLEIFRQIKK